MASRRKQMRTHEGEGFRLGLSKHSQHGVLTFHVCYTDTLRNVRTTKSFENREEALSYYTAMIRAPQRVWETVSDREADAVSILLNPNPGVVLKKSLALALALDKILSPRVTVSMDRYRENVAEILQAHGAIPSADEFPTWIANCINILSTQNTRGETLSKSTVKHRTNYFRRGLRQIASFSQIFGREIAAAAAAGEQTAKNWTRTAVSKSRNVEHYEPLGVAQVVQILDSLDSVSKKLWLLKSLSCGLRPSEVLRLNKAHVVNGALQLSKVISKTRTQKTPPVCTALKIILEIQESLGIAQPDDEELPDNVCRYALRSSAATHLVYSGIDHNSAADYLGHNTADMCLRTYSTKRPPGAGDSAKNYYRVKAVTIDGVEIAKDEPLYFKWLLSLLLRVLRDAGTQNDWQQTKQLALRIATEGVDEVDTDEVVGF